MKTAVLALAVLAAPAGAQTVDCTRAVAQMELNFCAEQEWQAADRQLNAAYGAAMAALKAVDRANAAAPSEAERLKKAQRAWIAYRDLACESEGYAMRGGSAEPLLIYGCLARLTESRTQDLRLMIQN